MRLRWCFVVSLFILLAEVLAARPSVTKTKIRRAGGKKAEAQNSGDYVVSEEVVVEEVDIVDGNGGDYVVEEEVVYVTEEDGYGSGTVTEVVYVDEEGPTGDETHVVDVTHDNGRNGDVIIVDGTEVLVDGNDDDVIIVVDGEYDYGDNGEEEEIVLILDEGDQGVTRDTIWYTSSTPFPYWTSPPQTYRPWTYPTLDPPWTYPTTTYPPWSYPTTTYPPWTYPPTTPAPWTYPTPRPTPWTYPTTTPAPWTYPPPTYPPWTYPTTTPAPWTYPPNTLAPTPTNKPLNSSCGCNTNVIINNNNYNYYNQGGEHGHGHGGANHTHVTTTVIHKYPQGKPGGVKPGNRNSRRIIKRVGNKQRLVNTGNGARRRLYTRRMLPKNLGVASGTNNVQVYRVLNTGKEKRQLVKNLRKRPMQVFKVKAGGNDKRNNTVAWKVVPRWKAQRLEKLGSGVKIGQIQQRRMVTPGVRKANQRVQRNKKRFNNKVMRLNKQTGNNFGLQELSLGLQNRLVKRRVTKGNSTPKFVRKSH